MSSSAAASRRHWRRSGSSDSGFDSASGSESERPYAPAEARPRRTRTLMTPQQLTILHALLEQVRVTVNLHSFSSNTPGSWLFLDAISYH